MSNIVYLDGLFVHSRYGLVHLNDRGYQFADAAYEVVLYLNGVACDLDLHLDRLDRTLKQLKINFTMSRKALMLNMQTLLEKNNLKTGTIYIQISRGIAPRNHPFPSQNILPLMVMTTKPLSLSSLFANKNKRLKLKLIKDYRWGRCDLKTVGLLPNVLAMQDAIDTGYDDALFYDQQGITEGTSWNFWILNPDNTLQTRPLDNDILHGITRQTILKIAQENNLSVIEKPITLEQIQSATEAFATSATKIVMSVGEIDSTTLPAKTPIADKLFEAYTRIFNNHS